MFSVRKIRVNLKGVVRALIVLPLMSFFVSVSAFELITPDGVVILSEYSLIEVKVGLQAKESVKVMKRKAIEGRRCLSKNKYQAIIESSSIRYGVNKALITAIISVESCFNSKAVSRKGAQGLMQLMPVTARRFGVIDSFKPSENVGGGVRYLRFLLSRYKNNTKLAIAAYNAGEGAVDNYNGVPPYKETQAYVEKVLALQGRYASGKKIVSNNFVSSQRVRYQGF